MELGCPTVGHKNEPFTQVNGWLLENAMATPPIYASGERVWVWEVKWWKLVSVEGRILFKRFEMKKCIWTK